MARLCEIPGLMHKVWLCSRALSVERVSETWLRKFVRAEQQQTALSSDWQDIDSERSRTFGI